MDAKEFSKDFIKDSAEEFADMTQFRSDHRFDFKSVTTGYMEGFQVAMKLAKSNSVLDDVINGFYDWHKSKGYTDLKRDDLEEYVNSLKK